MGLRIASVASTGLGPVQVACFRLDDRLQLAQRELLELRAAAEELEKGRERAVRWCLELLRERRALRERIRELEERPTC